MQLDKAIKKRKSVRAFKRKKPDWRDILECIDSVRYAPMAGNNFTLKIICVSDKEKIKKLSEAAQQPFVATVDYIVVFCTNPSRTVNCYGERGKIYCRQQAGAAIENFLLKIVEKGLSTCWTGHFVDEQVKKILDIPENIQLEGLFPIGYSSEIKWKDKPKPKSNLDNFLFFDTYGNKKMKNPTRMKD